MTDEQPAEPASRPETTLCDAILGGADFASTPAMQEMIRSATRMAADSQAQQDALIEHTRSMIHNSPEVRTARASQTTADALSQLLDHTVKADRREQRMLFWTRVSAIAAITAVVLTAVGIIVTLAVA